MSKPLPRVVITERLDAACADWLGGRAQVVWVDHTDTKAVAAALATADAAVVRTYTQVNPAFLAAGPNLKSWAARAWGWTTSTYPPAGPRVCGWSTRPMPTPRRWLSMSRA